MKKMGWIKVVAISAVLIGGGFVVIPSVQAQASQSVQMKQRLIRDLERQVAEAEARVEYIRKHDPRNLSSLRTALNHLSALRRQLIKLKHRR